MARLRDSQEFRPTATMELYAAKAAKMGLESTQKSIANAMRLNPETVSRWKAIPGFEAWLEERVVFYSTEIHEFLEATAIAMAKKDHRYWESLSRKYSYLSKEQLEDHKEQRLVIHLGGANDKQEIRPQNSERLPKEESK